MIATVLVVLSKPTTSGMLYRPPHQHFFARPLQNCEGRRNCLDGPERPSYGLCIKNLHIPESELDIDAVFCQSDASVAATLPHV